MVSALTTSLPKAGSLGQLLGAGKTSGMHILKTEMEVTSLQWLGLSHNSTSSHILSMTSPALMNYLLSTFSLLIAIWTSPLTKYLFKSFIHFYIKLFVFYLSILSLIYEFWIRCLSNTFLANIFFHLVAFWWKPTFSILMDSNCLAFSYEWILYLIYEIFPYPKVIELLSCFIVLPFTINI